jgi:hypothetical protein
MKPVRMASISDRVSGSGLTSAQIPAMTGRVFSRSRAINAAVAPGGDACGGVGAVAGGVGSYEQAAVVEPVVGRDWGLRKCGCVAWDAGSLFGVRDPVQSLASAGPLGAAVGFPQLGGEHFGCTRVAVGQVAHAWVLCSRAAPTRWRVWASWPQLAWRSLCTKQLSSQEK